MVATHAAILRYFLFSSFTLALSLDEGKEQQHVVSRVKRVVNGEPAGSARYIVSLRSRLDCETMGANLCAGSLISVHWAVSNADCFKRKVGSPCYGKKGQTFTIKKKRCNYQKTPTKNTYRDYLWAAPGGVEWTYCEKPKFLKMYRSTRLVTKFIIHEGYDPKTYHNAIAVFKMKPWHEKYTSYLQLNFLRPIKLAISEVSEGTETAVTGWGQTGPAKDQQYSTTPQRAHLTIRNHQRCVEAYAAAAAAHGMGGWVDNNAICALGENDKGYSDSCAGDGGGPLVGKFDKIPSLTLFPRKDPSFEFKSRPMKTTKDNAKKQELRLIGIVNFGQKMYCNKEKISNRKLLYPGVYLKIKNYIMWIKENTGLSCEQLTGIPCVN